MEDPERTTTSEHPLTISATVAAGRLVVNLDGEVDIESVPVLQAGMDLVAAESAEQVVIDLHRVSFLSPHALSVLVRSAHRMERRSRRVEFRRPTAQVRRILEWTGRPLRLADD